MNHDAIKPIGKNQASREGTLLFMLDKVEGLVDTFDKDYSKWSNFDCWENMGVQQWIFQELWMFFEAKK